MGDRCYLGMSLAERDLPILREILHYKAEDIVDKAENGIAEIEEQEADYGWYTELQELAKRGIPFYGNHGPGGEYDAHSFCGLKNHYYEVGVSDGDIIIKANEDGSPNRESARNVKKYLQAVKQAVLEVEKRAHAGPKDPPPAKSG